MASRETRRSTTRRASGQTAAPELWRQGKWWLIGSGVIGALVLLAVLTPALSGQEAATDGPRLAAPDFTVVTESGDFQLSEHKGNVVLLYFSIPG